MNELNRRGFLGAILVAAVAPAIVRASSLMPIYVPSQRLVVVPQLRMNGGLLWQDALGTIPVTAVGQPVGLIEHAIMTNTGWDSMRQEHAVYRPTFGLDHDGPHLVFSHDRCEFLAIATASPPPFPLAFGAYTRKK